MQPDSVYRVAQAVARVFPDPELQLEWLRWPNPSLGGEKPIRLARTEAGARAVEIVLNRIAWGDFG